MTEENNGTRPVPVVTWDELPDEAIQQVILEGFAILSIRGEVPLASVIHRCYLEVRAEQEDGA